MFKLLGIIAIVAVIGFVAACSNGSTGGGSDDESVSPSPGKLTITNFSGNPGLTAGNWVIGIIEFDNEVWGFIVAEGSTPIRDDEGGKGAKITGSSITLDVYYSPYDEKKYIYYHTPYTGNITIETYSLFLLDSPMELVVDDIFETVTTYYNKVPITFKNGSATINFGAEMVEIEVKL
jgi:hypothetical protein